MCACVLCVCVCVSLQVQRETQGSLRNVLIYLHPPAHQGLLVCQAPQGRLGSLAVTAERVQKVGYSLFICQNTSFDKMNSIMRTENKMELTILKAFHATHTHTIITTKISL